jgi:hypothetical protein
LSKQLENHTRQLSRTKVFKKYRCPIKDDKADKFLNESITKTGSSDSKKCTKEKQAKMIIYSNNNELINLLLMCIQHQNDDNNSNILVD